MKGLRLFLIILLTLAALMMILTPSILTDYVPAEWIQACSLEKFPLMGSCLQIGKKLIEMICGRQVPNWSVLTEAMGEGFWQELMSLLMVAVFSLPVSLLLGALLYKPLYKGIISKMLLYCSLNLVSVMVGWILYNRFYYPLVIENLILGNIQNLTVQSVANYLTQFVSAAAIGTIAVKVALTVLATKVVISKIILPIIGTFVRTLLFAFIAALFILLHADYTLWTMILPLVFAVLLLSSITDYAFGS